MLVLMVADDVLAQVLLDDQVVKTQAMRASPFIKPLEAAAIAWEQLLLGAQVWPRYCLKKLVIASSTASASWQQCVGGLRMQQHMSSDHALDQCLCCALQDLLDNWLTCQATWQYLEPIFSSPDILKQMPEEGEKFAQVKPLPHCCIGCQLHVTSSSM